MILFDVSEIRFRLREHLSTNGVETSPEYLLMFITESLARISGIVVYSPADSVLSYNERILLGISSLDIYVTKWFPLHVISGLSNTLFVGDYYTFYIVGNTGVLTHVSEAPHSHNPIQ